MPPPTTPTRNRSNSNSNSNTNNEQQQQQQLKELEARAVDKAKASADAAFRPAPSVLNAQSAQVLLTQVDGPSLTTYTATESVYVGRSVPVAAGGALQIPITVSTPGSVVEYAVELNLYNVQFGIVAQREEGITVVKVGCGRGRTNAVHTDETQRQLYLVPHAKRQPLASRHAKPSHREDHQSHVYACLERGSELYTFCASPEQPHCELIVCLHYTFANLLTNNAFILSLLFISTTKTTITGEHSHFGSGFSRDTKIPRRHSPLRLAI